MRLSRLVVALFCLWLPAAAQAQQPPDKPVEKPAEASPETKADLTEFIKKQYPGVDPTGEHNYTKIKNYTDARKRFDYTRVMARLIGFYIDTCGHGAIIAKQFDAWANTELVNQPTFNVLHAVVCMRYPDGRPNLVAAQELLNKALQLAPKFEYAHYLKSRLMFSDFIEGKATKAQLEASLDAAFVWPDFQEAATLKARLRLMQKPADNAAARAILEKCFDYAPEEPAVFIEMMGLYAEAAGPRALLGKLEVIIGEKKLSKRFEGEARAFMGYVCVNERDYDAAIKHYDAALALVKPEDDPPAVVRWQLGVAGIWASMAAELRGQNPKLEGQNRKLFDAYVKTAREHCALAAELERTLMPVDARGAAASAYIRFVGKEIGDYETVIRWLSGYLETTTLRSNVRSVLEATLNDLRARVGGDEAAAMKNLKAARDVNVNALIGELAQHAENVRLGRVKFVQESSFRFFLELIGHENATVAQLVALLLVDTALRSERAGDLEAAAKAITSRLEQEKEMTTEARVQCQGALLASLLIFDKRNVDLGALKALRKIVSDTRDLVKTESELINEAREVIELVNNDEFLKKLWGDSAAEHKLRSTRQRRYEVLIPWLDEQIAQLEKLVK